ncbi:MAG: nucleotide exchange factor GrpE [Candidatus Hinthialibacter sp.]
MGLFRGSIDPKEAFPIENFPVETLGDKRGDALTLLYRRLAEKDKPAGRLPAPINIDQNKEDFFHRILPILDGFDSIFRYTETVNIEGNETLAAWMKTLHTLYRRLLSALEKEGLEAIESVGAPLDLSIHEVVDTREDSAVPDNVVMEEIVKGYKYGRRVLRDAKVIVAKNPSMAKRQVEE